MGKYDNIEGSRDVNGAVTPTTLQPIDQVTAEKWHEMSAGELLEQRGMLYARSNLAAQYCPQAIPSIRQGIAQLNALIGSKTTDDIGLM